MLNRLIISLLLITIQANSSSFGFEPLEAHRWKFRIIVYDAATIDREALKSEIDQYNDAITDRDLRFIALDESADSALAHHLPAFAPKANEALRQQLKMNSKETELILIGKDGGLKARINGIDFPAVFRQIDQMPMRRAEMEDTP